MAYGDVDVLRGVDLDIHRGEVFALLGPNGAGKTTTVEILEGFRRRSAGDVRVLGADPERGDDAWRGRLGLVLQSWRDHPAGGSPNCSRTSRRTTPTRAIRPSCWPWWGSPARPGGK